jgi:hypothetical protein
MTKTIYK